MKTPKTNAERQRAYKARQKAAKLFEVRGIYSPVEHRKPIREFAKKLRENKSE